jgi:Trehalase
MIPKLIAYHRWLFRERVRPGSDLITLIHPWECGLDSTPPWMRALREWRKPWWVGAAERLHLARLLRRLRYDTRYLPAADRASDDDGLRMLALAVHLERYDFALGRLPVDRSVLIEDVAFNAMFAAANDALTRLGATALADETARHRVAFELLWHEPTQQYCSRDAVTHELLTEPTVAGFLPLFGGTARGAQLVERLRADENWPAYPVPSVPVGAPHFHETRYWKGPTWVNTNWMIVDGLERCGETELAADLRRRTLDLVDAAGCSEYFSPLTGEGHGAGEFSWTAALAIDLAHATP